LELSTAKVTTAMPLRTCPTCRLPGHCSEIAGCP